VVASYSSISFNIKTNTLTNFLEPNSYPRQINFNWGYPPTGFQAKINKQYLVLLKGCGTIYHRQLFGETTYNSKFMEKDLKFILRKLFNSQVVFERKLLIVTDKWSSNPYHFWVDLLGRAFALMNLVGDLSDYSVILPDTHYMRTNAAPLLKEMELQFNKIIFLNADKLYLIAGKITFVSLPHKIGSNNKSIIEKIQSRVFNNTAFYKTSSGLKIYYFRKNRRRVVVNDDDVQQFLSDKGFICTDFDDMSYLDAWRLMAKTKVLMGIHGGGMTNMFFMPRGSTVVEFRTDNPDPQSHCYWHLAWSLGHAYTLFIGESTTPGNNTIEGSGGCDIKVDIDTLSEWFEQNNL
jgi:capsular polysaccharide biosynthesis protein